jgi:hypothetical protein
MHIMTIGVVEWNLMIGGDDNDGIYISTQKAALTLRNFIEHFFACEVCRQNFLTEFDGCALDRCNRLSSENNLEDWIQYPVWLFEEHNSVSVRLLNEKYQREKRPSPTAEEEKTKQWPARHDCPNCWHKNDHGGFDDVTIYKFLRMEYWPEDEIAKDYRVELLKEAHSRHSDSGSSLPTRPSLMITLTPLMVLAGLAALWYKDKSERRRSGMHKKQDGYSDCV